MRIKLLEIRDRATFIPAYAIKMQPDNDAQRYLLRRGGYLCRYDDNIIILGFLNHPARSSYDPYDWNDRTMQTAHNYIAENFDALADGDVVDVEFILGEATEKKQSERYGDL
jgi:hypothetical protein